MADGETKQRGNSGTVGCVAIVLLWAVLLLHFFADRIWDEEPAVLKWAVIGYGCLVLLGLVASLAFGKRDEKIGALVLLAVVALFVAFIPPRQDRQAVAAVDTLVRELSEKGARIEQRADALPEIPDKPARRDLEQLAAEHVEETEWFNDVNDLLRRATELLPRAPSDKRRELNEALERFNQQVGRANEKRGQWLKKIREKGEAQKKPDKSG
jgi:hypothetical protein